MMHTKSGEEGQAFKAEGEEGSKAREREEGREEEWTKKQKSPEGRRGEEEAEGEQRARKEREKTKTSDQRFFASRPISPEDKGHRVGRVSHSDVYIVR